MKSNRDKAADDSALRLAESFNDRLEDLIEAAATFRRYLDSIAPGPVDAQAIEHIDYAEWLAKDRIPEGWISGRELDCALAVATATRHLLSAAYLCLGVEERHAKRLGRSVEKVRAERSAGGKNFNVNRRLENRGRDQQIWKLHKDGLKQKQIAARLESTYGGISVSTISRVLKSSRDAV